MNWIPNILRRGNDGNSPASLLDCLSLDLEVGRRDQRIHAFASIGSSTGETLIFDDKNGRLDEALTRLDELFESKSPPGSATGK